MGMAKRMKVTFELTVDFNDDELVFHKPSIVDALPPLGTSLFFDGQDGNATVTRYEWWEGNGFIVHCETHDVYSTPSFPTEQSVITEFEKFGWKTGPCDPVDIYNPSTKVVN